MKNLYCWLGLHSAIYDGDSVLGWARIYKCRYCSYETYRLKEEFLEINNIGENDD